MNSITIPQIYKTKKYNLLYFISVHPEFSKMKTRIAIEEICDKLNESSLEITDRTMMSYVYLQKEAVQEMKYSLMVGVAKILNITVEQLTGDILNVWKDG